MTGFSDYLSKAVLNWLTGSASMPAVPAVWQALFTTQPADDGTGGTEVSGGSYARVQVAGTVATNGTTASGNPTLNFSSVPAWVTVGMTIYDLTNSGRIPAATTVLSKTGTTVVMSANATGAGVASADSIAFSAFGAASGSAPSTAVNTAVVTYPTPTALWGDVVGFALYDASTSGNYLDGDYLGAFAWLPATVSSASPGVITAKAHGYSASDKFVFSTEYGGTAPSFSQSNFTGLLTVTSPAADTMTAVNVATAVNTSSTGSGMIRKVAVQTIPNNVQASFAAGQLTLVSA